MRVLLTPLNNLLVVREILWAQEVEKLDQVSEYQIKIGYNDGEPIYLAQSDDSYVRFYLFDKATFDKCEDLGEL